jgi:hypothetical protein
MRFRIEIPWSQSERCATFMKMNAQSVSQFRRGPPTQRHAVQCNGEFFPSSRVSPLTAVDLLVQFLDHRHRSSAHSILVPVPILLDVPILRSSLAPRPHTSSSRSRSAPSCRRRHRLPPCQCSLLPPLPPPPAAPFLCLISLSSSSSLYSSSQSRGAVLGLSSSQSEGAVLGVALLLLTV